MRAIREGNVHLKYDADFVFSEVNGDKIDWVSQVRTHFACIISAHYRKY